MLRRLGRAAGHAADDHRRLEPLAEQRRRQVDVVEVAIGQRVVHQRDFVEQGALVAEFDLARGAQGEMVALALLDARRVVVSLVSQLKVLSGSPLP